MNQEKERRSAQREKILEALKEGPQLNTDLTEIALRYSARIHELRKQGWVIRLTPVSIGVNKYTLVGHVNELAAKHAAREQKELF